MPSPSVSVIVGFKNWGVERLDRCLESLRASTYAGTLQIVVSDYGSDDQESVTAVARRWGADYLTSEPINGWSRAGAINAGLSVAAGDVLIATDVDMIFLPTTITAVVDALTENPHDTIIIQCRDLPRGYSHGDINLPTLDWNAIAEVAQLRPRWGMGGFVAHAREIALRVRGLDERLHTYGGEDIDYATRCRRAGSRITWLDDERARIYHMWHAPTVRRAEEDLSFKKAIEENRRTYQSDSTVLRNLDGWEYATSAADPAISFILGGAESDFGESVQNHLESILSQEGSPLEVIVATSRSDVTHGPLGRHVRVLVTDREVFRWRPSELESAAEYARGTYVLVDDTPAFVGRTRGRELLEECHGGVSVVRARSMRAVAEGGYRVSRLELGDLLFERRALIAALRTFPDEYISAARLVEHMARNGFIVRESRSTQRLALNLHEDTAAKNQSWIRAITESATLEESALDSDALASAQEMMAEMAARYTLVVAVAHSGSEDTAWLSAEISGRHEIVGAISDPAGGSTYLLRAYSGLDYALARKALRHAADAGALAQLHAGDIDVARDILRVGAAVLSSVYGAPVADHNWILAEIPGASDRIAGSVAAAIGSTGAANSLLREIVIDDQRATMLLVGPAESSHAVEAMLKVVEMLPDNAAVSLQGPVPGGSFGGDSK